VLTGPVNATNSTGNFYNLPAGNYQVTVTDANGCTNNTLTTITTGQGVSANFMSSPFSGGAPLFVNFINQSQGATQYQWWFGNGDSSLLPNPSVLYTQTGNYLVMLIASNGFCTDTAYATIEVLLPSFLEVYNVFSPNSDGTNDNWLVNSVNIKEITVWIYNRWGQIVFEAHNTEVKWNGLTINGDECPEGTYYYILKATGLDKKEYDLNGHISLFR
jgi:gliding motility-associated-like protein